MAGEQSAKRVAIAALLTLLSGCGSDTGDWNQYSQIMRMSLKGIFGDQGITRTQAAEIPYASLGYRVDGGREAILVLATDTNGEQIWTSASHVVLTTQSGRIVRTVGLPHNRSATIPQGTPSLPPLADSLKGPYRSTRVIDLPDLSAYSIPIICITSQRGAQTITIIGVAIPTVRIEESCRIAAASKLPKWSFVDDFWIDPDSGFVWHSIQHLTPATTVQTEIFRPPG